MYFAIIEVMVLYENLKINEQEQIFIRQNFNTDYMFTVLQPSETRLHEDT